VTNHKHISPSPQSFSRPDPSAVDARIFLNRELSLLAFFRRVLEEAQDEKNPLLERVKFLAIVASNLAEFFMIRVAGIKQQIAANVWEVSPDGLTPVQQLNLIHKEALELMQDARVCLSQILVLLEAQGIYLLNYDELDEHQRAEASRYFDENIFPVITPMAYDPGRPFPHISNMSSNLAVTIRDPRGQKRFARVKIPSTLPRLVPIPPPKNTRLKEEEPPNLHYFVWIEQLIARHLDRLFPGMEIIAAHPFRVTRDADIVIQELEAEDLLETIEHSIRERRFGSVVRLTIDPSMPKETLDILANNLELEPEDIYTVDPPLGLSDLMQLYSLERHDLKYPPFLPHTPSIFKETENVFAAICRQDILLHHPYDSFSPVVNFLQAAANDPDVLAIKQTLYRVGRNSPIVEALLQAARNGKQVAVLVELKARFDEESNIEWARTLEREGVHVVYGLLGLKTHAKLALVVRREEGRLRRYLHLATGNYNTTTAHVYTDLGLLTCDEDLSADVTDLFNYLTGYSEKRDYRKILVAPINLRQRLEELIREEIEKKKRGEPAHLIFKVNALVDERMIRLLYEASQAGVKVDLLVRGMCCLRPGVDGLSENIRVTSIVGPFLEHSRIFYFYNGGEEKIYLGSADLMPRNLDRRVEVLFPIRDARLIREIRDQILATYLADNYRARLMLPDGSYKRLTPQEGSPVIDSQAMLLRRTIAEN